MIDTNLNPEILRQLTRIADAANASHAGWTEWSKAIVSFIAGLFTAYLGDLIKNRSSDANDQDKMRRIVYTELAQCFLLQHSMIGAETELKRHRYGVIKNLCAFDGEAYMKENPAIFYGLPEGQTLTQMYYWFHRVDGGGLQNPQIYGLAEMKAPLRFFSKCYQGQSILRKNFKKILESGDSLAMDCAVKAYERPSTLEEWVDSGVLEIVETPQSHESHQNST
jgi:hypothetical protein